MLLVTHDMILLVNATSILNKTSLLNEILCKDLTAIQFSTRGQTRLELLSNIKQRYFPNSKRDAKAMSVAEHRKYSLNSW